MAKTIAPLFSLEASGQLAKTLVYDRRGYVRNYVVPTNPKTENQANIRHPFAGVAAVVRVIHPDTENVIRAAAENAGKPGYRWTSFLVGEVLRGNGWDIYDAAFNNLTSDEQDNWQAAAESKGIAPTVLDYGTAPTKFAGRSLFIVAYAMHERLNMGVIPPDGGNYATWADYIAEGVWMV
ncbi:MAG: hypothetical protein GXO56_07585 [Chloroflexi bacterium]|nr:hypothetical protein [Chloroflexota bacterium]